jgi:type II secretory pathway pseudopilin PulG
MFHDRAGQRGFSLIETVIAMAVVMLAVMSGVVYMSTVTHQTKHNKDKEFAVQKAISILEELKAMAESANGTAGSLLDEMDDGVQTNPVLTIDVAVTDPGHPLSGNIGGPGNWRFERQISIRTFASLQSKDVRLANVKIFEMIGGQRMLMAEVASVIRTIADSFPPSQVYDVYCLAAANVPGWWIYMANLVPFVERAIQDLESRNPGLEFRTHWIRKLAFGRDREYTPFINAAVDSASDIDHVYFYPGTLPIGSAVNTYYVPDAIKARINVDGTVFNDYDAADNPFPYALADTYNHAMRYPDEKALFDARVAAGLDEAETPTLRLLLDDMYADPGRYQNALLVNLHGELFPFPPVRNYSDPAKDPETHPGVRAVAHPEFLRYDNDDNVGLRVYSYLTDPGDVTAPQRLTVPISVFIQGLSSIPGLSVQGVEGGLDLNPADSTPDVYAVETGDTSVSHTGDMYYSVQAVTGGTLIRLFNSPLRTPCVGGSCSSGGIDPSKRLYDMEYIPTPLDGGGGPFSRHLASGGNVTKNTARWRIVIPDADLPDNARLTIETRIDDDLGTGVLYPTRNDPANLSRTYVYRGSDLWIYGDGTPAVRPGLPLTERFQVLGDPRHNPYADLVDAYSAGNRLGMGYNRYFDDFHNQPHGNLASDSDYWPGFTGVKNDGNRSNDGWDSGSGYLEIDINRIFQMLRSSLLRAQSVYTTLTGWSYYYIGIGNEIGYDSANGFADSIPVSSKPFTGVSGTRYEQSITDATIFGNVGGVKYIRESLSSNYWWGIYWLGELYPDSEYATWRTTGNLPTGLGSGRFVRVLRSSIGERLPLGTAFLNVQRRTHRPGCTTFFSAGTPASKFHHQSTNGVDGTLAAAGSEIASSFNFLIPDTVGINRPFNIDLNASGPVPDHFQASPYDTGGLGLTELAEYYDHPNSALTGSSLLQLTDAGNDVAFVVVNGLSQTAETGSAFIARWSFLSLAQSFMNAGLSTDSGRIRQLPQVSIQQPNDITEIANPGSIPIQWSQEWKRWDGQKYTPGYANGFSETTPIVYAVTYSDDGGKTWKYAQDDLPASPGVRPGVAHQVTGTTYTLSTPANRFPQGSYILRVEGHRANIALHYAYHQQKIFIER